MERLKEMAGEDGRDFAPLIDILEGGETLENLFEDRSQLRRPPGRMSALTAEQVQQLRDAGVIERKSHADGEIRNVVTARTIPKPNGLRRLIVNGRNVSSLPESKVPYLRRTIGVVFQGFRLIPRKTVFENVAYLPKVLGLDAKEQKRLAHETLSGVGRRSSE